MSSNRLIQLGRRQSTPPVSAPPTSGPRVYFETYGCQMNVADSELIEDVLHQSGFRSSAQLESADIIVINTCAVREKAEEKVFRRAEQLRHIKKRRPDTVLAIVGCMAEHLKATLSERAPYIDVIAGPDSYRRIGDLISSARSAGENSDPLIDVNLDRGETYSGLFSGHQVSDSGFVTIQRGCDKFCTFCVVPFTRGRERGVAPREILRRVRHHVESGGKEVTLLGQTVNSYRYEDVSFAMLLRAVASIDGLLRVRFTSPYPVDFSDDVIDVIGDDEKVCSYVHLPLQSGSDDVLARMRRGYTSQEFLDIVSRLRERVRNIAISTDILSGFCGETESDHQLTLSLMRQVRFDSAFMFSYSERELTFAAKKLEDDVDQHEKKRRLSEIIALQEEISREVFAAQVGRVETVLIHGISKRSKDQVVGRTDGFKSVILPTSCGGIGDMVDVEITDSTMATLFGRPL